MQPDIQVFDSSTLTKKSGFLAYDFNFKGGVFVTTGDVDGDGKDEIIVGANRLGISRVKVYKTDDKRTILGDYVVYDERFKGGVNIACGDIDLDGKDEIVTAANGGGGPHVKLFEHWQNSKAKNLFVYPESFRGGVNIALGNITDDKKAEIITAPGLGQELQYVVGYSSQERMIKAVVFGQGLKKTLFVGGTHAGTERNTVSLMNEWIKYLDSHPGLFLTIRRLLLFQIIIRMDM